jgi:sulfide dehydrogenase cytochrome subunit
MKIMNKTLLAVTVALAPIAATAQSPTGPAVARDLAAACAICHGTNGVNAGGMSNLAGQPRDYIVQQMRDFRDGKRPATIMHQIAKGYSDAQYQLLAGFFSAQKTK